MNVSTIIDQFKVSTTFETDFFTEEQQYNSALINNLVLKVLDNRSNPQAIQKVQISVTELGMAIQLKQRLLFCKQHMTYFQ